MEAFAWDLETNTKSIQRFTVQHKALARGNRDLNDPRDIYERVANDGARRLRARILAILPPDIVDAALDECKKTLAGNNGEPASERARKMIKAFSQLGVSVQMLEARLGHSVETALPEEFAELQSIFVSIREGMTKAGEWFGQIKENPTASILASLPSTPKSQSQENPPSPVVEETRKPRVKKAAPEMPTTAVIEDENFAHSGEEIDV
jgi:hypothetical protein